MEKMNQDVKKRWVEALRSGKYKQNKNKLRTKDGNEYYYCCLGVLCDLYYENGWNGDHHLDRAFTEPPKQVCDWAGLKESDPYIAPNISAMKANDSLNMSFDEIATLIEENL
jgi:hypothetical protein